ncbi:MAG: membrane integrity-associated transporter subunit PqiC [Rhodospirillales bacterium]|nr:membrane integrity-associated transporter subunit PqiC [Rhodospirillales bacterium]
MYKFKIFAAAALLLLSACSQSAVPEDRFYRLAIAPAAEGGAAAKLSGVVEINRFTADGLTAGRSIVYSDREDAAELQSYHYRYWIESPTIMLQQGLISYLRGTKTAATLVTPDMRVEPNFTISGKILRFEQVRGGEGSANVELELGLQRSSNEKLILLKTYKASVRTGSDRIGDTVSAMGKAVNKVFEKFVSDLPGG